MAEPRWLDETEMQVWRAWLRTTTRVVEGLERDLQTSFGRSLAEYEVLVQLSEADGRRLRMAELADASLQSRSRLTHTVDRLERCGLVARQRCDDDRRGTWAELTETGMAKLVAMAPVHVASVRRRLIDAVEPTHLEGFGAGLADIAASLDEE